MKRFLVIFLLNFLVKFCFAQNSKLVGAWHWGDSKTELSFFFKADSTISFHKGKKGDEILDKDLKQGRFVLKNNILTIKWTDNSTNNNAVKFINDNSFQVSLNENKNSTIKHDYIFRKVVDEEIIL